MNEQSLSLSSYSLDQAAKYREETLARNYQFYSHQHFIEGVERSHQAQREIEASDTLNFDDFLADYFK